MQVFNQHGEIPNVTQDLRKFRYSSEHTPYIYGIVPSAAAPGDVVQVHGSYRWSRLYMQYSSDDPRLLVRSVEIGPVRCAPLQDSYSCRSRFRNWYRVTE